MVTERGCSNLYRLRIGDYRVIYQMEYDTIIIDAVLLRGEAYKGL
ncbi:type II toxin-antitoxin system RelE family toxin [Schaedlerella arabinosiphila]